MNKFKIKESYLLLLIVLGLVSLGVYTTYALFTASTSINDVVGITATLDIGKSLTEYEVITVPAGETKLIELNVVNSYNGNIYYGAWYQMVKGSSSDIDIGLYTEKNSNPGSGSLSASSNINLLVGITNNSTSSITLYVGVKGSLTNELNLGSNKILIPDGFTEPLSVTVNITNGTINNSTISTIKVKKGNNAIFNVIPNDGYQLGIDTQTCNGTLTNDGVFTINNITENKECSLTLKEDGPIKKGSLADHIITTYTSNNAVSTRTDFSNAFTETNDKIYTTDKTEDGSTVYYYAGNTTHNWVLFGGFYWRIIRTNEDGSVRMLYSGTSHDTTTGYIGSSAFNSTSSNQMYVGYMYGTTGSLNNNRINTNSSTVKQYVDNWYANNLLSNYDKYISRTAIYCSDRSIGSGVDNSNEIYFSSNVRLTSNVASYKCGANTGDGLFELYQAITDKFSTSTKNGGNGQLQYSIALITVDELFYAGGLFRKNELSVWYYLNSLSQSITGSIWWWTMSPSIWNGSDSYAWNVIATDGPNVYSSVNRSYGVRPVLSLKSCVKYSSGDGTPTNPYTVTIDDDCASKEN